MATGEAPSQQPTPIAEIQELLAAALPDPTDEVAVQTCVEYLFSPQPNSETVAVVADQLKLLKSRYVASLDMPEPPYRPQESTILSLLLMNADQIVPTIFDLPAMSRGTIDTPVQAATVFRSALRTMTEKFIGTVPVASTSPARSRHRHRQPRTTIKRPESVKEPESIDRTPLVQSSQQGNVPLIKAVQIDDHGANIRRLHQQKGFTAEDIANMYDFDLGDVRRVLGVQPEQ